MSLILYYCHACGSLLRNPECELALSLGESINTACCASCATAGRRIKKSAETLSSEKRPSGGKPVLTKVATGENELPHRNQLMARIAAKRTDAPPSLTKRSVLLYLRPASRFCCLSALRCSGRHPGIRPLQSLPHQSRRCPQLTSPLQSLSRRLELMWVNRCGCPSLLLRISYRKAHLDLSRGT